MQVDGKLQYYNFWGHKIPLRCFRKEVRASRFSINETNQNLWIPNKHLNQDGSIKEGQNLDYVIIGARSQIKCSGLFSKSFFEKSFLSE